MFPFRPCRTAALWTLAIALAAAASAQSGAASPAGNSFQSLEQAASAARDAGNADEAIRDYRRIVALRPGWAQGWWDLGALQYQANRYPDAVASLRRLTALAPNAAQGWSLLGLSEFETKDYEAALASLEKARALGGVQDPEIARVTAYHLALLLIRSANFDRAAALLHSTFAESAPAQAKVALGLALLRIPLLPSDIDPSRDALIQAGGKAAASADQPQALAALLRQYPKVPWLHYAYGIALARAGHTQEALAQQKLEATLSPANALPWIEISRIALQAKQAREALSAARHAVVLNAESRAAHTALAKALAATGNSHQAALEARHAARLSASPRRDPRTIALYVAHGAPTVREGPAIWAAAMQDYSAGHYPETVAALKSWVEQNPGDGTAWAVMGLSEFALKDYENARIHLQRGINLGLKGSPESLQLASDRLALLLIRDSQFDAATSLLRPLAGHAPMPAQIQLALGLALLRIPALPDSLDASRRSLAQSAGAIVEMLFASRYSEAFPEFQKLLAQHPDTPWLHYAYGDALDSLSHYDDAKAQMRAELKLSPHSALPWIRLASISLRQHLPVDALKQAQDAVAAAPRSPEAHYQLGRAWLESGEAQKAIAELEKANYLKPNTPEIHFALARAYTKANQPQKAAAERAAFMQLKAIAAHSAQPDAQGGQSILKTDTR